MPTGSAERIWKPGRGKLGPLLPLIGSWEAEVDSPIGHVRCARTFTQELGSNFIVLRASWIMPGKIYEELAVFGTGSSGGLGFWSFTSDGKHSEGLRADASDVHAECIAFEAQMPAGLARMLYWPEPEGGFNFAVESRNKKGWNRFLQHRYRAAAK